MDYEQGKTFLPVLQMLKGTNLLKNSEWEIIHIGLLPSEEKILESYTTELDAYSNGRWLANGVNHEGVYLRSGIYYKPDGTHFDDNLTFYTILQKKHTLLHIEYKCESILNLIKVGDLLKSDIPDSVSPFL